jgi:hypothetical protein
MTRLFKSAIMVIAGLACLMAALIIGFFVLQFFTGGAGVQAVGVLGVSPISASIGLIYLAGFFATAWFCFLIGIVLCAHGLVNIKPNKPAAGQRRSGLSGEFSSARSGVPERERSA